MKVAVFIERDGVLNEVRVERHQPVSPLSLEDFRAKQEAVPLLKKLKAAGLLLMATTNQPGLSRGYQPRRELDRMHELLRVTFALDDILVCPHDTTDACSCRRPKPGLLVEASFKWRLNLDHCFVISDKWQDAEAAGRWAALPCCSNPRGMARCVPVLCCLTSPPRWTSCFGCAAPNPCWPRKAPGSTQGWNQSD